MACGNKEHFKNKNIAHACGICKHWDTDTAFDKPTKEVCVICKKGACQFVHI